MQWIAGFGFSAGLVDMVLSSRNPLATHWWMLIPSSTSLSVSSWTGANSHAPDRLPVHVPLR
jgi:hypothetical protein